MKANITAIVGIVAGSAGLIIGTILPKPAENYGLAVVTGSTETVSYTHLTLPTSSRV